MGKYTRESYTMTKEQANILHKIAEHKNASKSYIIRTAFDHWKDSIGIDWLKKKEE